MLITESMPLALATPKTTEEFRNYLDSALHDRVANHYYQQHTLQTVESVTEKRQKFMSFDHYKLSVWDAIMKLNEIVDESDPDTDQPQIIHLLQTAESIRMAYPDDKYDWFHLVGLIHDLGKIMSHKELFNEPQWCVVGDTFPVGCRFSEANVFHPFFQGNPDNNNPLYSTENGVYHEGIGLDNVLMAWGHDEYLYQVMKHNKVTLPEEAFYVVRYHSFYPWHHKGAYNHLTNEQDRKMLFWVQEFQKHDLYSKLPEKPSVEKLMPYYKSLIEKYFPPVLDW